MAKGTNYRRADCCAYCKLKLDCGKYGILGGAGKETMVCDDFEEGAYVHHVPGLPAMSRRDWEILGA